LLNLLWNQLPFPCRLAQRPTGIVCCLHQTSQLLCTKRCLLLLLLLQLQTDGSSSLLLLV
jgi:hypothetical protein